MNNQQFRRLLDPSPDAQNGATDRASSSATSSSLGTKKSSFIPMTPRSVGGNDVDFARQTRERNAALQPNKKFKSAVPKGVKFAKGYTDRAAARAAKGEDAEDDKEGRIKALEEQMKLGQISEEIFESLRDEITGGDVGSTHLVKGLDRRLLERVRRGEDVLGTGKDGTPGEAPPDVDDELLKLEAKQVEAVQKERVEKKGTMAPPPQLAGAKRSRDEIMAEVKAQRKAASVSKAAPALDNNKWRKVGDKKSRIEIDHKGREVLITVDEDGVVKKKVRKLPAKGDGANAMAPDASKPVLGADTIIPEAVPSARETQLDDDGDDDDDDDDIFEGVGTEYNPLGDQSSDADSDSEVESESKLAKEFPAREEETGDSAESSDDDKPSASPPRQKPAAVPRNYFKDTLSTTEDEPQDRLAGVQDLLKKAAKMDTPRTDGDAAEDAGDKEEQARLRKRAEMLAQRDRDLDDMDMGFGGSRGDDGEEDGGGLKTRLSEWKGSGSAEDGWEEGGKEKEKKKRKPKKRKGDGNNMSDIMRVIEGRKDGAKG